MHRDPVQSAAMAGDHLHRFHGGLRLRHNKKISCLQPVSACPMPQQLCLPLLQHRGEAAQSLVAAGDTVLKGQLIGSSNGSGAHVHAPASGTVVSVGPGPIAHPSGKTGEVIFIKPDGKETWINCQGMDNWAEADPQQLRAAIRAAGIVGLGGAVFPTADKVDTATGTGIQTLIINGAECEPYISCDEMLMREQPDRIVLGSIMLQKAVGAERCIIAIEDQMGAVRAALLDAIDRQAADTIIVKRIPTIYPEGGERQLVQVLTGLEVPDGGFPHQLGLLVQNVGTAAAVADAIELGQPLLDRYVTVTGSGVKTPRNLRVLLGTPVADLVAACGGYAEHAQRLVVGGPMMGFALASDAEPIVKASNCILVLNADDVRDVQAEMPCIRCGECARVCPAQLLPQELHFRITSKQLDAAQEWGLAACIECGCCDFVCPSHIPLVEWFRHGKSAVHAQQLEREFSEHSRQRFEARAERLEKQKAEKAGRLAKRKQALKSQADKQSQVKAAIARSKSRHAGNDPDSSGESGS